MQPKTKKIFLSMIYFAWGCWAILVHADTTQAPSIRTEKNKNIFQKAVVLLEEQADYTQAYKLFTQVLKEEASCHECMFYAAQSMLSFGKLIHYPEEQKSYNVALELCEKALSLSPNNPEYTAVLSYIYATIGLFDRNKNQGILSGVRSLRKSIRLLDEVIGTTSLHSLQAHEYDPIIQKGETWVQALIGRAEAYRDSPGFFGGDKEAALRILRRIHEKIPNHPRGIYVLGRTYQKDSQTDKAQRLFLHLTELYKKNEIPKTTSTNYIYLQLPFALGETYWEQKNYTKACALFSTHLQRYTRSPWGHASASKCFEQQDNISKAKEMMKAALRYDPFNKSYQQNLTRLNSKSYKKLSH